MTEGGASLLRNPRFVKLWVGQAFSFVGDAVSMVALVVLVVEISGSAPAVGGVLLARLVPTLASPFVGVLADRLDRRAVLVASDLARAGFLVGMVFADSLPTLYVLAFLTGAARTMFNPTVRAAFPSVVGGGDLTRANAIVSGTFSFSITVGPALGGLLVATVGVDTAFLLDAATFLVSAVFLTLIPLPRPEREEEEGFVRELRAGLGHLAGARIPLAIVAGAFLFQFATEVTVPAEVFLARSVFDAGDFGYGLLVSLWGGGMVVGSALLAALGERVNLLAAYFIGVFVSAAAFAATGVAPVFAFALAALALAGFANGIDNVTTDTILQKRVPEALLGRVFSVRLMSFSAAEALAYPTGGLIVDSLGAQPIYLLAGAAIAISGLVVLLLAFAPGAKRSGA